MRGTPVVIVAGALLLGACSGGGDPSPTSSAPVVLRPIAACAASVTVPAATNLVTPKATSAPVSQLLVGQTVSFVAAAGAAVGAVGAGSAPEGPVLCDAGRKTASGRVTLVGTHPGFVKLGVRSGTSVGFVLVRVTG